MSGIIQYFSDSYYKYVSPEEYVFIEKNEDEENSLFSITSSDEESSESESVNSNWEDYQFRKSDSDSEGPDKINKLALINLKEEEVSDSEADNKVQDRDDSPFSLFPDEIIIHIFSFLSPKELTFCATVCQSWKRLMESDFLWKPVCRGEEINRLFTSHLNWKETYKYSTESHLLKAAQKREPRLKTLEGHSWKVNALQLKGNTLVSGSSDKTIKIWNLSTYKCVKTLEGHYKDVNAIQFQEEEMLASGSSDKTIRIWDLSNGICTKTFENAQEVSSLQFHRTTLVSGSWYGRITFWDLSADKSIRTLEGHSREISVLKVKGNILASGSFDNTIKIWDLSTYTCIKTLKLSDAPRSLQFKGTTLFSGINNGDIRIWNLTSYECVQTLQENSSNKSVLGHKPVITAIEIQGKAAVSSNTEGTIIIWDLSSSQPIKKWKADFSYSSPIIWSLQLQGTTLVSGGEDKTIKIWDFSKKKK